MTGPRQRQGVRRKQFQYQLQQQQQQQQQQKQQQQQQQFIRQRILRPGLEGRFRGKISLLFFFI